MLCQAYKNRRNFSFLVLILNDMSGSLDVVWDQICWIHKKTYFLSNFLDIQLVCFVFFKVLVGPRTDGKILGGEISTCLMEWSRRMFGEQPLWTATGVTTDARCHAAYAARKGFCVLRICQSWVLGEVARATNGNQQLFWRIVELSTTQWRICRDLEVEVNGDNWDEKTVESFLISSKQKCCRHKVHVWPKGPNSSWRRVEPIRGMELCGFQPWHFDRFIVGLTGLEWDGQIAGCSEVNSGVWLFSRCLHCHFILVKPHLLCALRQRFPEEVEQGYLGQGLKPDRWCHRKTAIIRALLWDQASAVVGRLRGWTLESSTRCRTLKKKIPR